MPDSSHPIPFIPSTITVSQSFGDELNLQLVSIARPDLVAHLTEQSNIGIKFGCLRTFEVFFFA